MRSRETEGSSNQQTSGGGGARRPKHLRSRYHIHLLLYIKAFINIRTVPVLLSRGNLVPRPPGLRITRSLRLDPVWL